MTHTVDLYGARALTGQARSYVYNAMDCLATHAVAQVLLPRLTGAPGRTYAFERASQEPAFAMTLRGILVDVEARAEVVRGLQVEHRATIRNLNKSPLVDGVWDGTELVTGACPKSERKDGRHKWARSVPDTPARTCDSCGASRFEASPFNPGSHPQCYRLLYKLHGAKPERNKTHEVSTDDDCLERIGRKKSALKPLTDLIIKARKINKQIGFLKARLSRSGRYGSVFNVGAAWTGRWSSNKNPYGEGGNSQNIAEQHRRVFVADPGFELCYMDLKQAESNTVAHLSGDEGYIDAHASGDVHTYVTRLLWPDLPWTGNDKEDSKLAKAVLPEWDPVPGHDIRFQSKRIQHGGNYGLRPAGIAMIAHIPQSAARSMFNDYHATFPMIQPWQRWVGEKVRNQETLVNPFGVEVKLFGRPWDDHTTKQGLSYLPQSTVGHIVAVAAWRISHDLALREVQLLAQVHDALLFQFPKGRLDLVHRAAELMTIPVRVVDFKGQERIMQIEVESAVGANWGHRTESNPGGLHDAS